LQLMEGLFNEWQRQGWTIRPDQDHALRRNLQLLGEKRGHAPAQVALCLSGGKESPACEAGKIGGGIFWGESQNPTACHPAQTFKNIVLESCGNSSGPLGRGGSRQTGFHLSRPGLFGKQAQRSGPRSRRS